MTVSWSIRSKGQSGMKSWKSRSVGTPTSSSFVASRRVLRWVVASESSRLANTPPDYIFRTCWEETSRILYCLWHILPRAAFGVLCTTVVFFFFFFIWSAGSAALWTQRSPRTFCSFSSFIPLLFCTLMRRVSLAVPSVSAPRSRCGGWLAVSGERLEGLKGRSSSPSGSRPRTGSHSAVTVGGSIVSLLAAGCGGGAPTAPTRPHQHTSFCVNFTQRLMSLLSIDLTSNCISIWLVIYNL